MLNIPQAPTKERKYFDWLEYKEHNLICEGGISIINGGRNIGKTTGLFIRWLEIADSNNMIFYIRNTLKEVDAYRKSFNAEFGKKWYMTTNEIWTVEPVELLNKKTGKIEIDYRKKDVIGFVATLNGTDGWRSANFSNIKYIYSDEYNQIGNSLDFQKFMTLWTSILRTKQNVYTVLVGNRDDASAEIIVELGIEIIVPEDFKGDWIRPLLPDNPTYQNKCWFIDLDDSRFTNDREETVWKALGRQSEVMGNYYDRGYKSYNNIDCRHLPKNTLDKIKWEWSYYYGEYKMIFGYLEDLAIVHLDIHNDYEAKTVYGSLLNSFIKEKTTAIEEGYAHIFWSVVREAKKHNIIYTSIAVKEELNSMLMQLATMIKEDSFTL